MMENQIITRQKYSQKTALSVSRELTTCINGWASGNDVSEKVCVYTTGSFGREDASKYSDLDTFILSKNDDWGKRLLTGLEEIELAASIISTNRKLELPEIDRDGAFLKAHSIDDYLLGLGKPDDDANNTFTGRLLLLLESKPIFGEEIFDEIVTECLKRYWVDFADHEEKFIPAFLLNDILRFWRTLCINYEAGNDPSPAKRRAKNYKLKFSRLLTCFSAIVGLQILLRRHGTVNVDMAASMLKQRPVERIMLAKDFGAGNNVEGILDMYNRFLEETNCAKGELIRKMDNREYYGKHLDSAREFGDEVFKLIQELASSDSVGSQSWRFLRYITI